MQNPFQSGAETNAGLNDPLNFVRKLWGDLQLPGMVTPTLSVDELDKQIRDLKTVESWLNLNLSMLRTSIQALEVQRATITALKAMGESFSQQASAASAASAEAKAETTTPPAWPMHGTKVSEAQADAENMEAEEDEESDETNAEGPSKPSESEIAAAEAPAVQTVQASAGTSGTSGTPAAPAEASFTNPAAWWNVLQEQFKHALGQALKDENEETAARPQSKKTSSKKSPSTGQKKAPVKAPAKAATNVNPKAAGSAKAVTKGKPRSVTASKTKTAAKASTTKSGAGKSSPRTASKVNQSA